MQHRLFIDTSGQLPSQEAKRRSFTQILNLSHNPTNAFVGTLSDQNTSSPALITIPNTDVDNLTALIAQKLQPLWYHRQSVTLDNGLSLAIRDGTWRVSVGDVRALGRTQAVESSLKGYLIELTDLKDEFGLSDLPEDKARDAGREIFVQILRRTFGEIVEDLDASNISIAVTGPSDSQDQTKGGKNEKDWRLAKLYMNVLRTLR